MKDDKSKDTKHSIRTLHSDPDNPREISTEGLVGLVASAEEYGDLSGIVFNRRTGELVTAHQRVKALRKAGATEWVELSPEEGYISDPRTTERFKVRIVDWDEAKQRAANIVANNPKIQGTFTGEVIGQLRQLEEENARFEELQLGTLARPAG